MANLPLPTVLWKAVLLHLQQAGLQTNTISIFHAAVNLNFGICYILG
jgi:hypothetical protein